MQGNPPVFPRKAHVLILWLWGVLICCVVIGSLLPAASPVMVQIGRLHINDKVQHFCAYLALSLLPVIGFRDLWCAVIPSGMKIAKEFPAI